MEILKIALTAGVGVIVADAAFRKGRARANWRIIKQYRPRHILASLLVAAAVGAISWGLWSASAVFQKNPVLWLSALIFHHGNGIGQGNLIFTGLNWKWYAVFFLPVLAFALPRLAEQEEVQYRAGTRNWLDGAWRSLRFGLVHLIMLIPFGAALALSVAGAWFTDRYFRGGTANSTLYHAAFNTVVVLAVWIALLVTW